MTKEEDRISLLLRMYDQMFNDINRHIMVVWQSVGVLVGAFTFLALTEKKIISVDLAVSIILLIAGWLMAHLQDSAYWYNRNLAIIANIERQFLLKDDLKNIHYYFGAHRPNNRMIEHLRIQFKLGIGVSALVLLYHLVNRVVPGVGLPFSEFDPQRALPYLVVLIIAVYVRKANKRFAAKYAEFIKNSPGVTVDTDKVDYGIGHGFDGISPGKNG